MKPHVLLGYLNYHTSVPNSLSDCPLLQLVFLLASTLKLHLVAHRHLTLVRYISVENRFLNIACFVKLLNFNCSLGRFGRSCWLFGCAVEGAAVLQIEGMFFFIVTG